MPSARSSLAVLAVAVGLLGPVSAFDGLGGFNRPYTNEGRIFGRGAWGNGQGTAIPLPGSGGSYGFRYEQPYEPTTNLFGTGFWAAEHAVRTGGDQGRVRGRIEGRGERGDRPERITSWKAEENGWKDKGEDKDHEHGCKTTCGPDMPHKPEKPGHGKPPRIVYVPYPSTPTYVYLPRRSSHVVIERVPVSELGPLNVAVTEGAPRAYDLALSGLCIDGKGNEADAFLSTDRGGDPDYVGEIYRCPAGSSLRVSYETGVEEIDGAINTADGTSYHDCDEGDALIQTEDGDLVCGPKRPRSRSAERSHVAHRGTHVAEPEILDLTGMELTGGVGGM